MGATRVIAELRVCNCCAMALANGDTSGHEYDCEGEPEPLSSEHGGYVVLACEEDCEGSFSWSSCDGCGSHLGGPRHAAVVWSTEREET